MIAVPIAITIASLSVSIYMAFLWSPPERKQSRLFSYVMQHQR
jgi:hypothetical protein